LTPALSRGERENGRPVFSHSPFSTAVDATAHMVPSPSPCLADPSRRSFPFSEGGSFPFSEGGGERAKGENARNPFAHCTHEPTETAGTRNDTLSLGRGQGEGDRDSGQSGSSPEEARCPSPQLADGSWGGGPRFRLIQ